MALFLALSVTWGMSFLFIKVTVEAMSPLWVVAGRTAVGSVILVAILLLRGRRLPPWRAFGHLAVLAALGNAIPWTVIAWAQQDIPSGLAAVINSLTPASTLAVATVVGVERLTGRKVAGLVLALAGTAVVVSGELGAPGRAVSVLAVAGATVLYGASAVYAKRFVSGRYPPLAVASGQVVVAAVAMVTLATVASPVPDASAMTAPVVLSLLALGAFGTGIAFLLFYMLIARVGPTNSTMVTYVIPVVGLTAGWLILQERVGLHVLVGAAVIAVGIWLAQRELTPQPLEELQEIRA